MSYATSGDVTMGKPSKGTKRDRRLKRNKRRKAKSKLFRKTLVGKIGK